MDDVAVAPHADGVRHSMLLRKSKVCQEAREHYTPLRAQTMLAIEQSINHSKLSEEPIFRSIDLGENISSTLGSGQINRIYKRLARQAGLSSDLITRVSEHSFRVGAAEDFIDLWRQHAHHHERGRWTKSDSVMRYLEQFRPLD
jgi:integrase